MKALRYRLRLVQPLLVAQIHAGEENSAVGMSYIPGSTLRGAIVGHYVREENPDDLAFANTERALFLDGTVAFLNAYPYGNGTRMLPRPRSWLTEKDLAADRGAVLYDFAVQINTPLEQPKAPKSAAFCVIAPAEPPEAAWEVLPSPEVALYTPPRQINVHISLEKPNTRTDENAVYRYDAIAEGEVFEGAIVASDDFDLAPLQALLVPGEALFLGGAHTAGYGRALIEDVVLDFGWEEYEPAEAIEGKVVLTLLSDLILRGDAGQVDADLDAALSHLLGFKVTAQQRFQQLQLVGGFNRKWGLPLVQDWALGAGSVYVYADVRIDPEALQTLLAPGIGERRAEGFGRVAVNWHTAPQFKRIALSAPVNLAPRLSSESQTLAARMAQRRLQTELEQGLVTFLSRVRIDRPPQNPQLARVRNVMQQVLLGVQANNLDAVVQHLDNLKAVSYTHLTLPTKRIV